MTIVKGKIHEYLRCTSFILWTAGHPYNSW